MPESNDALPDPSTVTANTNPLTLSTLETQVARIWADALERTDVIGPEDSFFDLGGDSLSMMIVLFQIGEQLGVELSQATFLDAPSLRQFCILVESAREEPRL